MKKQVGIMLSMLICSQVALAIVPAATENNAVSIANMEVQKLNTQIQKQLSSMQRLQQQQMNTMNSQLEAKMQQMQKQLEAEIQQLQTSIEAQIKAIQTK
ncbi:MAG: hypothetical protein Q8R79_08885 [Legionellaceae bacterium]|nr:hypothetical protein [Legionellaceae bacterium]